MQQQRRFFSFMFGYKFVNISRLMNVSLVMKVDSRELPTREVFALPFLFLHLQISRYFQILYILNVISSNSFCCS